MTGLMVFLVLLWYRISRIFPTSTTQVWVAGLKELCQTALPHLMEQFLSTFPFPLPPSMSQKLGFLPSFPKERFARGTSQLLLACPDNSHWTNSFISRSSLLKKLACRFFVPGRTTASRYHSVPHPAVASHILVLVDAATVTAPFPISEPLLFLFLFTSGKTLPLERTSYSAAPVR